MTHSTADAAKRERDAALARKTPMLARCPKGCAASPVVGGRS